MLFGRISGATVFIRNSQHIPPPRESVPHSMAALFELLAPEDYPDVRAVHEQFAFVRFLADEMQVNWEGADS